MGLRFNPTSLPQKISQPPRPYNILTGSSPNNFHAILWLANGQIKTAATVEQAVAWLK
jgi:hypothetical protein